LTPKEEPEPIIREMTGIAGIGEGEGWRG